jgi:hypothetical protein
MNGRDGHPSLSVEALTEAGLMLQAPQRLPADCESFLLDLRWQRTCNAWMEVGCLKG